MLLDKATEEIAHFIGLFETTVEQVRMRQAFKEFDAPAQEEADRPDLKPIAVNFTPSYDLLGYDPGLFYRPLGWSISKEFSLRRDIELPKVKVHDVDHARFMAQSRDEPLKGTASTFSSSYSFQIDPPGSVAVILLQTIRLSDDDVLNIGDHGLDFRPTPVSAERLTDLVGTATELSPMLDLELAGSADEMIAVIEEAALILADHQAPAADTGKEVFLLKAETLEGIYVNGVQADAIPDYETYRPPSITEDEKEGAIEAFSNGGRQGNTPEAPGNVAVPTAVENTFISESSVDLKAGENLLVNSAQISNEWLASPVFAIAGNHVELNAIVQVNVWQDIDLLGGAIRDWALDAEHPTLGFNIASFTRVDPRDEDDDTNPAIGGWPSAWAITEISGDLIILNWIEQFTFMLDNDIAILSASGAKATAITGANGASNALSLDELGYYYDLIVVGGNIYDANLIQQMNVLLDNDLVAGAGNFHTSGEGTVSAAGNLFWNEANIFQVGGADRFQAMPEAYRAAVENLRAGKSSLPDGVLQDPAFAGMQGLRVLYINGDFLNLQYVKQTNVLGDADQVALAMDQFRGDTSAHWNVSTGGNTLVNLAGILDVDGLGKTFVGGDHYSDEILIQAEFIESDALLGSRNPDALVSEAVVFLGDDMLGDDDGFEMEHFGLPAINAPHPDIMQTMLA